MGTSGRAYREQYAMVLLESPCAPLGNHKSYFDSMFRSITAVCGNFVRCTYDRWLFHERCFDSYLNETDSSFSCERADACVSKPARLTPRPCGLRTAGCGLRTANYGRRRCSVRGVSCAGSCGNRLILCVTVSQVTVHLCHIRPRSL